MRGVSRRALIHHQGEIPDFASQDEELAFWDTHELSEEAIEQVQDHLDLDDEWLPPVRARQERPAS